MNKHQKFTFVKLVRNDIDHNWVLIISSIEDLLNYFEVYESSIIEDVIADFMTSEKHLTNELASRVKLLAEVKEESFINTLVDVSNQKFQTMLAYLVKHEKVVVNKSGGFFWFSENDTVEILDTVESTVWPSDHEVRFLCWPNGTHWYAKIGDIDVVIDGKQKWDTKEEAEEAVEHFLRGVEMKKGGVKWKI